MSKKYDIVIIGAGPAGLTAAIYLRRASKSVLVLEKETFGGQITHSPKVENYPGFITVSGVEFADKLVDQVINQGAEIEMETVIEIRDNGATKTVVTEDGEHEAKAVIIAVGVRHRQLGLPNENQLVGNGVSYCAVCDGAFFKGQTVGVVGGGNSALQEAVLLSDLCEKVYVLQNLPYLTGEKKLADALAEKENVQILYSTVVSQYVTENGELKGILLHNDATGAESSLNVDGVFLAVGIGMIIGAIVAAMFGQKFKETAREIQGVIAEIDTWYDDDGESHYDVWVTYECGQIEIYEEDGRIGVRGYIAE